MSPKPHLSLILRWLIRAIDFLLRRLMGIVEFDSAEDSLIRVEFGQAVRGVRLADGTHLQPGDAVLELHLWNEHLLSLPSWQSNLRWATVMRRRAAQSLRSLARHMRTDHRCDDIKALLIRPALAGGRRASVLSRIVARHGFEVAVDVDAVSAGSWLFRSLDNLWLWFLAWTFNPASLRDWRFDRRRSEFWMSRARFVSLYGGESAGDKPA